MLTNAGETCLTRARSILAEVEALRQDMRKTSGELDGTVKLGGLYKMKSSTLLDAEHLLFEDMYLISAPSAPHHAAAPATQAVVRLIRAHIARRVASGFWVGRI